MKDLASVSRGTYKERLVVVSNRGPFTWGMSPEGVRAIRSVGGLVSALEPLMHTYGGLWVAWGGREEEDGSGKAVTLAVKDSPVPYFWKEVLLSKEQVRMYYH
ncbi:MAG: trehalose-6-phosphate synthase, partial [Clostridia bacterium]|nr:trehalose-6-phosphate synthase [Clostridia bacterium]